MCSYEQKIEIEGIKREREKGDRERERERERERKRERTTDDLKIKFVYFKSILFWKQRKILAIATNKCSVVCVQMSCKIRYMLPANFTYKHNHLFYFLLYFKI
jgi:hypothetical protein